MTTPEAFQSSRYPESLDDDQNLHLVHDSLRVVLAEDYNPGDTSIVIEGDASNFPPMGIITLTDQFHDAEDRAINFYYTDRTATTFTGLTPVDGFDSTLVRAKRVTNVTQNVSAPHHNNIKDAVIAIQEFVGVKGTIDPEPLGETMEGRINFLRKLVLTPRAWFTADKTIGLVPFEVTFTNESFRLGDGDYTVLWDFGDSSITPISILPTMSVTEVVPISATDYRILDTNSGSVVKTYSVPNKYPVTLTVTNQYGSDTVTLPNFIHARAEAPIEAIIDFNPTGDQIHTLGTPSIGPYVTPPKIRSKTDEVISLYIPSGIHPTTLRTYAGEEIVSSTIIDPIEYYTWSLSDDLEHINSDSTQALYSVGGAYDLVLRCDTQSGAYRITSYPGALDIVEETNLWLFTNSDSTVTTHEFGMLSETFKTLTPTYTMSRNDGFLDDMNNYDQAVQEFNRNVYFAQNGTVDSGSSGNAIITYAGGGAYGSDLALHKVRIVDFQGFTETIADNVLTVDRPWNWIYLPFTSKSYYLFGEDSTQPPNDNPANPVMNPLNLGTLSFGTPVTLVDPTNFLNGGQELLDHPTISYTLGEPDNGRFAVYRTTTKDSTGYIVRNSNVGTFYQLSNFYRTEGIIGEPVVNLRKMEDMATTGGVKLEGQLVTLSNGVYFFNNSGNISAFNTVDGVWETGSSVSSFKPYQDTSTSNYQDKSNTLVAASDKATVAYLSFDYSTKAFIKYNSVDATFSLMNSRPEGNQWVAGIY